MYQVIIPRRVEKQINKLEKRVRDKVLTSLQQLQSQPRPHGVVKMVGYANLWRIKVEVYRIVYEIHDDELIVHVIEVDHRRDVYR